MMSNRELLGARTQIRAGTSSRQPIQGQKLHERWHHTLHPRIHREYAHNSFPRSIAHLVHPSHALLVYDSNPTITNGSTEANVEEAETQTYSKPETSKPSIHQDQIPRQGHRRIEQMWMSRNQRKRRFMSSSKGRSAAVSQDAELYFWKVRNILGGSQEIYLLEYGIWSRE